VQAPKKLFARLLLAILFAAIFSSSAFAFSDNQVFGWAEASYPSIFSSPGTLTLGLINRYHYRYYPVTGNYLVIDSYTHDLFILGPITNGAVTAAGNVSAYANEIHDWEATLARQAELQAETAAQIAKIKTDLGYTARLAGTLTFASPFRTARADDHLPHVVRYVEATTVNFLEIDRGEASSRYVELDAVVPANAYNRSAGITAEYFIAEPEGAGLLKIYLYTSFSPEENPYRALDMDQNVILTPGDPPGSGNICILSGIYKNFPDTPTCESLGITYSKGTLSFSSVKFTERLIGWPIQRGNNTATVTGTLQFRPLQATAPDGVTLSIP
jgi:hypothetical protein